MDVTVIKNYLNKLIILILIITLISCQAQKTYNLESLLEIKLAPPTNTHTVALYVKGDFSCPLELWILIEGSEFKKIVLSGKVDSIVYKGDWYGEELSFSSKTTTCIDKEATAKIIWNRL